MQCHNQPSCRRQGIQSFRLGSKSEPCGLTAWTGFGLLAFIIQLIQTLIQTLSPAVGGSWKTPIQKSLFFSKLCWEFQSAQHAKPLCLKLGSDVAFCCALTWLLWAFCLVGFLLCPRCRSSVPESHLQNCHLSTFCWGHSQRDEASRSYQAQEKVNTLGSPTSQHRARATTSEL